MCKITHSEAFRIASIEADLERVINTPVEILDIERIRDLIEDYQKLRAENERLKAGF